MLSGHLLKLADPRLQFDLHMVWTHAVGHRGRCDTPTLPAAALE